MLLETVTVHAGAARAVKSLGLTTGDYGRCITLKAAVYPQRWRRRGVLSNSWIQFYGPFFNTLAVPLTSPAWSPSCLAAIVAFLITRAHEHQIQKPVFAVRIPPHHAPSLDAGAVLADLLKNVNIGTGTSNGIMAAVFGIYAPEWLVWNGYFPHQPGAGPALCPFAYILIGGISRNMDAGTWRRPRPSRSPRWRIISRITMPIVKPAMFLPSCWCLPAP